MLADMSVSSHDLAAGHSSSLSRKTKKRKGGGGFRSSRLMKGSGRSKSPDGVYLEKGRKFTSKYQ